MLFYFGSESILNFKKEKCMYLRLTSYFVTLFFVLSTLSGCIAVTPVAKSPVEVLQDASDATGIDAPTSEGAEVAFDIVHTQVSRDGAFLNFKQIVTGEVGSIIPTKTGQLGGAEVESYVWPTSLDSSTVGFDAEQGILALAVTAHPDFDDTPLVDEDEDGNKENDGRLWHSHWVVLVEDESCGEGGLKVRDIPEGETPSVPDTWPELPLLIDSPSYDLELANSQITVHVPYQPFVDGKFFNYDGVTAGLKVNADLHVPLLCVTGIYDIASGDLSLPGEVQADP
ncbi:MAG: hypothetical protein R2867_22655 [Caldilineaceae bacterium]